MRSDSSAVPAADFRGWTAGWWVALAAIACVALVLRTHELARRPMHADEANQAVKAGLLLERGEYAFDPRDHHGPTLYYAALPIAWLRGQHTLAQLDEVSVRLVPALAGVAGVLLLAWLALPLGRGPALVAAALLTVSPPAVYYSRYFIQETLLVTFTLGAVASARVAWATGRTRWTVVTGIFAGLMLATKASAPLFLVAALVAVALTRDKSAPRAGLVRAAVVAALVALVVAAMFYSSFGANGRGLRDAFASYGLAGERVAGTTGHEKPWWYYGSLFAWQKIGGLVWHQVAFAALALGGVGAAILTANRFLRGVALYTGLLAAALSLTPYKTPWHVVHLVPGLALLAAGALAGLRSRLLAGALLVLTLATLAQQTNRAAFLRPADARNPYAYVHSVPDVRKYRAAVETALRVTPGGVVRVIGEEYWPLPWYLRDVANVGYWTTAPDDCEGAIVIATAAQADAVRARLRAAYEETVLGLRPGVICVVFTRAP